MFSALIGNATLLGEFKSASGLSIWSHLIGLFSQERAQHSNSYSSQYILIVGEVLLFKNMAHSLCLFIFNYEE